ncbi:MAG: FimB/Mfa2 family fimbrial subunit, partial [Odoribacteraceae bacterium]|nr:FimB/Mfa2 family fimbrial subunit [Odoribacteraceae bacterium]
MKQIKKLFPLAALALLAGACVVNMEDGEPAPVAGDDGRVVTLALAVPGLPASRAGLDDTGENAVETVDVLLFKDDKFYYRAIGSNIADDGGITRKKFNVRLPMGTYGIVVLANARAALSGIPPATVEPSGDPRATVLDALEQVVQPAGAPYKKWTEAFNRIPMWGYYKDGTNTTLTINEGVTTLQPINLTRAIARVDISVKDVMEGVNHVLWNKFSLESVHLYNYSRAGKLAPKVSTGSGNTDGYDGNQWKNLTIPAPEGIKAAAPHLPAHTDLKVKGPLEYVIDDDPALPHVYEYRQEIYTYEADAGTPGDVTNTCLVIGGYYDGNPAPTYYRVNFVNSADEPLPLLRNYKYNVEIQEVNGHGYPTPGDAYANEPANIVVTIVPWNEGGMNDVDFNGQHYLAVNKSELVFYSGGDAKSLEAITDFPAGWMVESLPPWLSVIAPVPDAKGEAGVPTTLKLKAGLWSAGGTRESFFYIVAGNLKKKITVRQLDEEEFSLEVEPAELVFYKTVTGPKTVTLTPIPAAAPSYTLGAAGNIAWETGRDPSNATHQATILVDNLLSLWPATNDGTTTRGSSVLVTLHGAGGKTVTRVVDVRQLARDPVFIAATKNPYPPLAGNYTFTVTSEVPWALAASGSPAAMLTLLDGGAMHAASPNAPYTYTFHLAASPATTYSTATRVEMINVTSTDPGLPAGTTIQIEQDASPYIAIVDPASKARDFGTGTTPGDVTFKTNAGWKFSGDASFNDVIDGVMLGASPVTEDVVQVGSSSPGVDY